MEILGKPQGDNPGKVTEKYKLTKNYEIKENYEKTCEMTGNFRKIFEKFCKFVTIKKQKFYKILKNLGRNCLEFRRMFSPILEMTK